MKILFVCAGNTCRSPMAEGIARKMFGDKVEVASAGTHAHMRDPPATDAVKVVRKMFGVDISRHRSRNVNDVHIENFDCVVPMADDIHDILSNSFPNLRGRLMTSWGIDDPYGGDLFTYEETALKIQKRMDELYTFLKTSHQL